MRIIDARSRPPIGAFLEDRTWVNLERTLGNIRSRGWTPTPSIEERSLVGFMAEMDAAGIELAGIPARVPNRWWGGRGNDPVFEDCSALPDRFFPVAAVNPFDHPGAADAVAALKARGARGIVVEAGIADEPAYIDDPRAESVYEACAGEGLPLLLMSGGEAGPDLSYCDPLRFDRVAVRHPQLQLVNVHGGWPYVQEALGVAFRRPNVWYLGDVYFPGLPGEQDITLAMRTFLQDRFLFSTGYPFCPIQETVDRYLSFGLTDDVLEKVMGLNAARLFGL